MGNSGNDQLLDALRMRLSNVTTRAGVNRVNNNGGFQRLQMSGRRGDMPDGVNHYLPFGFDMIPLPPDEDGMAAEGILIKGQGWEAVLPVADRRHRHNSGAVTAGDVSIYSASGAKVTLKNSGDIEIDAPENVNLTAGKEIDLQAGTILKLNAAEQIIMDAETVLVKANLSTEGARPQFDDGSGIAREVALISDDADVSTGSSQGRHEIVKSGGV